MRMLSKPILLILLVVLGYVTYGSEDEESGKFSLFSSQSTRELKIYMDSLARTNLFQIGQAKLSEVTGTEQIQAKSGPMSFFVLNVSSEKSMLVITDIAPHELRSAFNIETDIGAVMKVALDRQLVAPKSLPRVIDPQRDLPGLFLRTDNFEKPF